MTTVRAVVVSWNGAHLLPACLDSLLAQRTGARLEVLVVDNASTDGTAALLADRYPEVGVLALPRNTGFAGGVAAGTADWHGDHVLLLNNDAWLEPDALERMLTAMADDVGAVTAKIVLAEPYVVRAPGDDGHRPAGALVRADSTVLVPARVDDPDAVRVVNSTGNVLTSWGAGVDRDWLAVDGEELGGERVLGFCGGAALLRTAALEEAGGFDADLFLYYEDTDVSWRMRARGWDVRYAPDAVAHHRHAASSDTASPLFRYYNTRNSLTVALTHAPWPVVARSAARQLAGAVKASVRRTEPAPVRSARWRALRHAASAAPRALRRRRAVWGDVPAPRRRATVELLGG